jgi:hypothetical protein
MREVRDQDWDLLCQRLNEFEHGARVTIDLVDENGATRSIARNVALDRIQFGRHDACSDKISITGTEGVAGATRHDIIEPIRVRLRGTEDGAAFSGMTIEAESGTTLLTFHPVIREAWLDGVQLR